MTSTSFILYSLVASGIVSIFLIISCATSNWMEYNGTIQDLVEIPVNVNSGPFIISIYFDTSYDSTTAHMNSGDCTIANVQNYAILTLSQEDCGKWTGTKACIVIATILSSLFFVYTLYILYSMFYTSQTREAQPSGFKLHVSSGVCCFVFLFSLVSAVLFSRIKIFSGGLYEANPGWSFLLVILSSVITFVQLLGHCYLSRVLIQQYEVIS